MDTTKPIEEGHIIDSHSLTIAPRVLEPFTGAVWVHKDYQLARGPWEADEHLGPIREAISFIDVASWATYVQQL